MKKLVLHTASVTLFLLAPAYALDRPLLHEGLWSVHIVTTEQPGNKVTEKNYVVCRDHASDQQEEQAAATISACTKTNDTFEAGKRYLDLTCHMNGRVFESKSVISYTGDTMTRAVAHTAFVPSSPGSRTIDGTTDMKFIGTCPSRLKPGQREDSPAQP